ncbi:MAG: MBL fold metallo-hydrolase, partial [Clostridia bacterium]|nr:MBL fold metallo-hydrolase [Clostridia bacterium]
MQFCSVVSGSSGNCLFVREKDTRLLIDCGLSGKSTKSGLFFNGIDIADIDGVLITHEHIDHTKG